jgi:hypothetical protein
MRPRPRAAALALAVLIGTAPLLAAADPAPPRITEEMLNGGLFNAHPDLKWRSQAMGEFEAGRMANAFAWFQRAARYADKPSQAMVAEMYWEGRGVARDRALAYAWIDLAAERGWQPFVLKREQYWAALDEAERARALAVGQQVYAEYGDAVAKPRKESVLARERKRTTGSRTGFVGPMDIVLPGPGGLPMRIRGDDYYAEALWKPEKYWAWQDRLWRDAMPGQVTVGSVDARLDD